MASLLFAWILQYRRDAPAFQGTTVRGWLESLDSHVDHREEHERAADALLQIGPAAVDELDLVLRRRSDSWREQLEKSIVWLRLKKPATLTMAEQQFRAARAAYLLAERGDVEIRSLVPQLEFHVTNSTYLDSEAGRALAGCGPEGFSILTNLLATGDPRVRDRAAWALGLIRTQQGAVEALIRATLDPDRSVRVTAILSLPGRNGPTNLIVPVGLKFLRSDDGYERWGGASLLGGYAAADGVLPALKAASGDPDERVRSAASRAIGGRSE